LGTAAAAAIIVAAVNAATEYTPYEQALINTSNRAPCFPFCSGAPATPGGGGGGPGGGGPTSTAVATATNTAVPAPTATPDPRITAIQQLPLQGRAPSSDPTDYYHGGIQMCADGAAGGCTVYTYNWYGYIFERLNPLYTEPDRADGALSQIDLIVVVPNGDTPPLGSGGWEINSVDDLYSFDALLNEYPNLGSDPCSPPLIGDSGYKVEQCYAFPTGAGPCSTSSPVQCGPWSGLSARFKPDFAAEGGEPPPCAQFSIPGCPWDFDPSWHHRLM
jgi:hypothetical protein